MRAESYALEDTLQRISRYRGLIRRMAKRMVPLCRTPVEASELEGAGILALIGYLQAHAELPPDLERESIRSKVRSEMQRTLREHDSLSRNRRKLLRKVENFELKFEMRMGRTPSSEELAEALHLDAAKIESLRKERFVTESLPQLAGADEREFPLGGKVSEVFEWDGTDPLQKLLSAENELIIDKALHELPEKERTCVVLSFYGNRTLKEIGRELGFTEARASQLRTRALRRMGKFLKRYQ